jgi:hypothetical protein
MAPGAEKPSADESRHLDLGDSEGEAGQGRDWMGAPQSLAEPREHLGCCVVAMEGSGTAFPGGLTHVGSSTQQRPQ